MIDPNIALGVKPVQFDSPLNSLAQMYQIKQAQQQGQMGDIAMQEKQQSMADSNKLRGLFATPGFDIQSPDAIKQVMAINPTQGMAMQKARLDNAKAQGDIDKTAFDTATKAHTIYQNTIGALAYSPNLTKDAVIQAGQGLVQAGILKPEMYQASIASMPDDPVALKEKLLQGVHAQLTPEQMMAAFAPKPTQINNGQQISFRDTNPNSPTYGQATGGAPVQLQQSPDSKASTGVSYARLAFDKKQAEGAEPGAPASEGMVDLIGQGKMAPPTGYALRNPKILAIMEQVAQKYPDYDATEYAGKTKAMRDFSSGTPGNSIRSFAVASDHLQQLNGLVDALDNKNVPLINKYGNIIAQQTGSVAPTNFDAAKGIVAKEVLKSIVAGGGGVEERQELAHLLDNAKTEKQLKGVISTYLHLMDAQKSGLIKQYELSTGRKDGATRFNYDSSAPSPATKPGGVIDFGSLK